MLAVPAGADITVDVLIEAVDEGVLVTGTVSAPVVGECVICLSEKEGRTSLALTELFVYPDSETAQTLTDEDEVYVLDDPLVLDLEQALIDTIVTSLPFSPTCSSIAGEECPEDADIPRPDGVSGEDNDLVDPRWAGLEKFKEMTTEN